MNPFYKRLVAFGHLVQNLSHETRTNYKDYFDIEHPGFPVINAKGRQVTPRINFIKRCPKTTRSTIIDLYKQCFDNQEYSL
ncbi:hypothetical protein [Mucilaginibacter sp. KACC 22063]|uniref:hypothetical protein n=1 Tax=Mucilaginibacter sp. KACC 22063 TaxID=3025666 RepID=UPI0023652CBD|nr:hypothetical protein [Mucilaginibacter sp. KACC 22063]WDF56743.1 hypothetical protein PQ461_06715 [Mucilaginibacter sp. KACC 22063]